MEGSIQNKQRALRTPSYVLRIMQFPGNLPELNDIFLIETDEGWILIYIDDILIFSKEKEDLQKLTLRVLKKLQENDLFINLDKCTFKVKAVDYLGLIISKNQIKMDLAKLEGIRDWPTPTMMKQV